MAKLLLVVAWPAVLVALAVQAWRTSPARALRALLQGTLWYDAGQSAIGGAWAQAALVLGHGMGLAYLWRIWGRSYEQAVPLGLISAAALLLPQLGALWRRRGVDATALTPLVVPYGAGLLLGLHLLPAAEGYTLLRVCCVAAAGYTLLIQAERFWPHRVAGRAARPAPLLLLAFTGVWALAEYLGGRTHGVTGSDPYCYAQMAVDIARHHDPRHVFTLFPAVSELGIPWWPIVHVGYYPPGDGGISATVWPVGWPALLAVGYLLLGEVGLYVWAPLMGLLVLLSLAGLAWEAWPEQRGPNRWLGLALGALILATSQEQVLQLLVPMADVPAQLFSVLAVWLALRAGRRASWPEALLAGMALGVAYDIRHTQVFLAPVVAVALWRKGALRGALGLLAAAAAGACLMALPDLWYHAVAFGSPWRPESPELCLIGVRYWWTNAVRMAAAAGGRAEFGLLVPLLAYGAWRLWKENRRAATVLGLWILLNAGTQFLYGPLRWRDLLAVVPPLALFSAYGGAAFLAWLRANAQPSWAPGCAALAMALALTLRVGIMLEWPLRDCEQTFGYLSAEERRAFALLGEITEEDAVIGTSLNSGSVELCADRECFRPGDWSRRELETFFRAMEQAGRPVYIIDDGNEHAALVTSLAVEGRLEPVRKLTVPLYGDRERLSGTLYRVRPSREVAGSGTEAVPGMWVCPCSSSSAAVEWRPLVG